MRPPTAVEILSIYAWPFPGDVVPRESHRDGLMEKHVLCYCLLIRFCLGSVLPLYKSSFKNTGNDTNSVIIKILSKCAFLGVERHRTLKELQAPLKAQRRGNT